MQLMVDELCTAGSILDRAIEAEDRKHGDFLRLEHIEGYLELSAKTKSFFTTVVALWDADFYVKYRYRCQYFSVAFSHFIFQITIFVSLFRGRYYEIMILKLEITVIACSCGRPEIPVFFFFHYNTKDL
ncbi:unnamed protein product [Ilex paraguariensis]|uniref:Uncharacterized protein n=1 Tax=Ilex paraguariensis TaxID=185542 RepID=A0ABC8TKN7_9AQUA